MNGNENNEVRSDDNKSDDKLDDKVLKSMYKFRIAPVLKKVIQQNEWQIDKENTNKIQDAIVEQSYDMSPENFMELSNKELTVIIHEMIAFGKASKVIQSIEIQNKKHNYYDIRHKEVLRLFLREYFELFFPRVAEKMNFESAVFMDKELISILGDEYRLTDALILVQLLIENDPKWILIHWEQQSTKQNDFEKRMFRYFSGIYYQYQKEIFPIAMFTDSAKWEKPISDIYEMSLLGYKINTYYYNLIKLKNYKAEDFEEKGKTNPLAYAYLPLTDYVSSDKIIIKAKAISGVLKALQGGPRQTALISLIDTTVRLNKEEEKTYYTLIKQNNNREEVKMFNTLEEYFFWKGKEEGKEEGIEEGKEEGKEEGRDETIIKLLEAGLFSNDTMMQALSLMGISDTAKFQKYIFR